MLKKILLSILFTASIANFLLAVPTSSAQTNNTGKVKIEVLERNECLHCQRLKEFLDELQKTRDDIEVTLYDLSLPENIALYDKLTELEKIPKITPITLIGDTVLPGFGSAESTGKMIEDLIGKYKGKTSKTLAEFIASGGSGNVQEIQRNCNQETGICDAPPYEPFFVDIPLFGTIDVKEYSLPTLSIVLGFIDGFNPCAMWVLVTFLVVLVQIGNRRRMWQIAGLFILAEAIMYYLILNVWYSTWDFIGLDNIITPIVGLISIGGGLFFLYEGIYTSGTCNVTNVEQRQKTRSRIKDLAAAEMTLLTVIGIIGLALSVNIIEFACSVGIPQAFTKILDLNPLSFLMRQIYMGLYILFYMIDDFIVFGIALYSIEKIGITHKYSKISNIIGGILMLILGGILIYDPSLLVF